MHGGVHRWNQRGVVEACLQRVDAHLEEAPAGPALDELGASLKQIETSLGSQNLTDQALQDLRQQLVPVARAIGAVIDRLTPRLGDLKDRLDQLGVAAIASTPAELAVFLKKEMEKWGPVIKEAGITGTD